MQMYIRPFTVKTATTALAVTATSQAITLPTAIGNRTVRIVTIGTVPIYWSYDVAAVVPLTAGVTGGTAMLQNTAESFDLPNDVTTINFIGGGTGTTVYLTYGESA